MLVVIPEVLSKAEVARCRAVIDGASWIDGNATSGHQSALAKKNEQLAEGSPEARQVGDAILDALGGQPQFIAAALPLKVFPPLFNRYAGGQTFGTHVDNAVRQLRGTDFRVRSDLSATLFLSEPADYDGGELTVDDRFGTQRIKLPAGDLVLYPASSLHRVTPVTRGARVASFFWIQSLVRDDGEREILLQLDASIQRLTTTLGPTHDEVVALTGVYHNLLRRWTDC